jgi:hypothetical protein
MNKRTRDSLVAALAVVAIGAAIYSAFANRAQKINLDSYTVLGTVTAQETARLLADHGRAVVVARDTGEFKNPSVEAELTAFQQEFKKHPSVTLTIKRIQIPPMQTMATGGGLPVDQLLRTLDSEPNLGALILLLPLPPLTDSELDALSKHTAKIIVVSSFHPDYRRLLDRGLIQLAIVPRPDNAPADAPPARTVRERFDQEYAVIQRPSMER